MLTDTGRRQAWSSCWSIPSTAVARDAAPLRSSFPYQQLFQQFLKQIVGSDRAVGTLAGSPGRWTHILYLPHRPTSQPLILPAFFELCAVQQQSPTMLCLVPVPTNESDTIATRSLGSLSIASHATVRATAISRVFKRMHRPIIANTTGFGRGPHDFCSEPCKSCASGRQSAMTSFWKRGQIMVCGCHCRRRRLCQLPSPEEHVHVLCQECVQLCPRNTLEAWFT